MTQFPIDEPDGEFRDEEFEIHAFAMTPEQALEFLEQLGQEHAGHEHTVREISSREELIEIHVKTLGLGTIQDEQRRVLAYQFHDLIHAQAADMAQNLARAYSRMHDQVHGRPLTDNEELMAGFILSFEKQISEAAEEVISLLVEMITRENEADRARLN